MILGVAMQFIPVLGEEAETIRMAQTARGARFESKKLTERAASFLPLVIPVFLAAFVGRMNCVRDGGERLSRAGAANKEEKITAKPQRECGDCRECDFFDCAGILAKIENNA